MVELIFLKLGGSLITDKSQPYTPRLELLDNLTREITRINTSNPELRLILGHGSGSFGHTAAKQFNTSSGISMVSAGNPSEIIDYWKGFAEVHHQATNLNHHVMHSLRKAQIAAISYPPAATVRTRDREIVSWDIRAIESALKSRLVPVIFGDTVFDEAIGGTIVSTEQLFEYLSSFLSPDRILIAGMEQGVWSDFPSNKNLIRKISAKSLDTDYPRITGSSSSDVTGGMLSKVQRMVSLVQEHPTIRVQIFSGIPSGNLIKAFQGEILGTAISAE